jgi:hypothetical protein
MKFSYGCQIADHLAPRQLSKLVACNPAP